MRCRLFGQLAWTDGAEACSDCVDHGLLVDVADHGDLDRVGSDDRRKCHPRLVEAAFRKDITRWHSEATIATRQKDGKAKRSHCLRLRIYLLLDDRHRILPLALRFRTEAGIQQVGGADLHLQREVLWSRRAARDESVVRHARAEAQDLAGSEFLELFE